MRHALLSATAVAVALSLAPASAQEAIRFGSPLALTGPLADAGQKSKQGYDICVSAINEKGGVDVGGTKMPVEIVEYDYQSETNRAVQLVQRLINVDEVNFLFAPYGSGDTMAAARVAERYGVPMVAASAATPTIFDENYTNLFGVLFPNSMITDAEVAFYKAAVPDAKTIAVLRMNSLYPRAIGGSLIESAGPEGYEVVYDQIYSPGTTDFANALTEIKSLEPDWIYATGYTQDLIIIRRQMADLDLDADIVTMTAGPSYPEYAENLGALANGVTTNSWWHQNAGYEDPYLFGSSDAYNTAFNEMFGRDATYLEAAATVSCEVLALAIEQAGSLDAEAVRDVLHSETFNTFYGPISFGDRGQNTINAALVMQIQDGALMVLDPAELKQSELSVGLPSAD